MCYTPIINFILVNNIVILQIGPGTTCWEVCKELSGRTDWEDHEVCLTEVVVGGALSRPLHHSELLLDVVLRWSYWDEIDSKDNYLALTPNTALRELRPLSSPPLSVSSVLKYADDRTKSFKSYLFQFSQAKLSYYKDKNVSI